MNPKVAMALMREVMSMIKEPSEGITVQTPTEGHMTTIEARIEGPSDTPYADAMFHLYLAFPSEFPMSPPKGYFTTKIFHPNVSAEGEICVNTLKRDWDAKKWSIRHILQVIRCLLIAPFPESALNQEAGKLFMESYEEFAREARLITKIHASKNVAASKQFLDSPSTTTTTSSNMMSQKSDTDKAKEMKQRKRILRRL